MKNFFLFFVLLTILNACTPDYSDVLQPKGVQIPEQFTMSVMKTMDRYYEKDNFAPKGGFKLGKRKPNLQLDKAATLAKGLKARGKGKGRNKPTTPTDTTYNPPPTDTTNNPPTDTSYSSSEPDYVLYLDVDGGFVTSSYWNINGPLTLANAGLQLWEYQILLDAVSSHYYDFNVLVTMDSTEYFKRPAGKRLRIYLTQSWEWYGQAGGVAYLNSMSWGDDTPAFVFTSLLGYSTKYISDATTHEGGHGCAGLRHQCDYIDGVKQNDYSAGITPDRAPHMGVAYYDADGGEWINVTPWYVGNWFIKDSYSQDQNDYQILMNKFGPRKK